MKFLILFITLMPFIPSKLFAATSAINKFTNSVDAIGSRTGLSTSENDPSRLIGNVINGLLDFLGVAFLVLIIYGGIIWMTAAGNEQKVERAKKIIMSSAIGLSIIILSRIITFFILDILLPRK